MLPLGGHGRSNAVFTFEEVLANVGQVRFTNGNFGEKTGTGQGTGVYTGWNDGPEMAGELWIDDIKLSSDPAATN